MPIKKVETKKADSKKAAPAKKAEPKKAAPAKKAEPKKEEPKKVAKDSSVYHVSKNAETGRWEIKLAKIGGAAGKVQQSFRTKEEAMERAEELMANTGRKALVHKSKGANKGKVHKI